MIAAIGWVGSAICVWSLMQVEAKRFRASNLAACAALIVFNVLMGTWSMVVLNAIIGVINARQLMRLRSDKALEQFVESSKSLLEKTPA